MIKLLSLEVKQRDSDQSLNDVLYKSIEAKGL